MGGHRSVFYLIIPCCYHLQIRNLSTMSHLVSIRGMAGLCLSTTVLLFHGVATAPLAADICDLTNPVFCPKYGICCTGTQFCYQESGTCEECFPLDIKERKDRLKFCSEIEWKKTTLTMRHYSCNTACITLFNLTEITDYVEPAPSKTKTIQESIAEYNSTVHKFLEKLKEDIDNQAPGNKTKEFIQKYVNEYNSTVHKFLEKLKEDIDNQAPGNKTKEFIQKYVNEYLTEYNSSVHKFLEKLKVDIDNDTKEKGTQTSLIIAIIALILVIILAIVIIIKPKVHKMLKKIKTTKEVVSPLRIQQSTELQTENPTEIEEAESPLSSTQSTELQTKNPTEIEEAESPLSSTQSTELQTEDPTEIEVDENGATELKPLLSSHGINDEYDDNRHGHAESNYKISGILDDLRPEGTTAKILKLEKTIKDLENKLKFEENHRLAIENANLKIEALEQKAKKKEEEREKVFNDALARVEDLEKQLKLSLEEKSRVEQDVLINPIATATGTTDSRDIGGFTERDTTTSKLEMLSVMDTLN